MEHPLNKFTRALSDGLSRRQVLQRVGGLLTLAALSRSSDAAVRFGSGSARGSDSSNSPAFGGDVFRDGGYPRFQHTATPLPDGRVLLAGGFNAKPLSGAQIFDPFNGRWQDAAPMKVARAQHAATLLPDGRVLVVGGISDRKALSSAEIYDPSTNIWTPAPPMPSPRFQHSVVTLRTGHVLVTGGYYNRPLSGAELYDPAANRWSKL